MPVNARRSAREDVGAALAAAAPVAVLCLTSFLVLGILAADRAVGDVFVLERPTGIPSVVAASLLGLVAVCSWVRSTPVPAALFAGAALVQLGGLPQRVLIEAGVSSSTIALVVAIILIFSAVLVVASHRSLRAGMEPAARGEALPRLTRQVRRLDPRRGAVVLAVSYLAIGGLGAIVLVADLPVEAMVINAEGAYPQYFNGLVLAGVALLSTLAWSARLGGIDPRWWLGFALFLAFLAVDESIGLHERVQSKLEIDAKVVLAPIALAGLVLFIATYRAVARLAPTRAFYLVAAACFALSQLVDVAGDSDAFSAAEELLELAGSCLFLAALFLLVRAGNGEAASEAEPRTGRAPTAL